MGYNECIEAAGTPVLAYIEDGDYEGEWYALTGAGFYTGTYGSCSVCDWREGATCKQMGVPTADLIDAAIGRKILKDPPMTLMEFLALPLSLKVVKWAENAWLHGTGPK